MSSLERREYTLEELIPFGGGRATQEANRAELARLRAIEAAAEAHRVEVLTLIDSRQAVIDERNSARADVAQLRNHIFGCMQYLHNIDHEGDIWACPRGICPGVRGVLRLTQDAESWGETQVVVPDRGH